MLSPKNKILKAILIVVFFVPFGVSADTRQVVFPEGDGIPVSYREGIAFAREGRVGYVLAVNSPAVHVLSFSVDDATVVDSFDLSADFGALVSGSKLQVGLNAHRSGLLAAYGLDATGAQKVLLLESDAQGHLAKRWAASFPTLPNITFLPAVAFNDDGSRLYVKYYVISANTGPGARSLSGEFVAALDLRITPGGVHNSSVRTTATQASITTHVTLLRCNDGSAVGDFAAPEQDLLLSSGLIYDAAGGRVIVGASQSIYLFKADNESLEVESVVGPVPFGQDLLGIRNGRYLISYGGYLFGDADPARTVFYSIDLQTSVVATLAIPELMLPFSNKLVYQESSGIVVVPYSIKVIIDGRTTTFLSNGTKLVDLLQVSTEGTIQRNRVRLPQVNESVVLSPSGALALVATQNGNIFGVDTETGGVVNEASMAIPPNFIALIGGTNRMVIAGTKLLITNAPLFPVILDVAVGKTKSVVMGANFLQGARLTIDGAEVEVVKRDPADPGSGIIINRGKKDFARGESFTLILINRDGSTSEPFTLTR